MKLSHHPRLLSTFSTSSLLPWRPPFLSLTSLPPTKPTWNSTSTFTITNPTLLLLENCSSMSHLKQIQAHMTRTGLFFHVFPVSRIVSFCALSDSGDIHYAQLVFDRIEHPNVYIWNTMIRGYCKARNPVMGMCLFRRIVRERVEFDSRSFVFGLKACGELMGISVGKSIHCGVWKLGFESNLLVRNGLIHFYGDNGCLSCARKVFDECSKRDVVTWTAMIDGYVQKGVFDEGLRFFDSMVRSDVMPNEITMITVLSACGQKRDLGFGRSVHEYIERNNICRSLNLMNAVVDMYVKCGSLSDAREIFARMEYKDVFSWTSMINGYAKHGEVALARRLFDEMPEKNVVSWNTMIAGYSQNNQPIAAMVLFYDMIDDGLVPIEATLVCVLSACAQSGCMDLGQWIHHHYVKQKQMRLSVVLANAFIDMYSKCGNIDTAEELFNQMSERDIVSWNSMIVGYADHGHASKALILFEEMKNMGVKPDDITLVGVLSACSHGGLVSKGKEYFTDMKRIFGLEPKVEHYACMIDLLGRVGQIEEAYDLIRRMPMEPDEAAWGSLLNACRMHGKAELGRLAAEKLIDLDPEDSGIYVLLANLCASAKRWSDVRNVRSMMRERGIKKNPGRSSIEVEGKFHEFSVADDSHPHSKDIYKILDHIFVLLKLEEDVQNRVQSVDYFEDEGFFLLNS